MVIQMTGTGQRQGVQFPNLLADQDFPWIGKELTCRWIFREILEIKYLDFLGVGLNLDACVSCGAKANIVTIDGDRGGYICSNCYQNEMLVEKKTIELLRMYYYVEIKSISKLKISEKVKQEINTFLNTYYDRYTGLYLKSKNFLKKLMG